MHEDTGNAKRDIILYPINPCRDVYLLHEIGSILGGFWQWPIQRLRQEEYEQDSNGDQHSKDDVG